MDCPLRGNVITCPPTPRKCEKRAAPPSFRIPANSLLRLDDPRISALQRALAERPARLLDADAAVSRASVALLLRPLADSLEFLLIERPRSVTDPWSGHMALPGGRRQGDEDALDTAIRETFEEVGIDLREQGVLLGRLDDVKPSRGGPQLAVAPFVFAVPANVTLIANPNEVAQTVWIPLAHLTDPASAAEHLYVLPTGGSLRFPALSYHGHVIWGLTYRMLLQFLGIARSAKLGEVS
jgi:8-oxo-dGTP pyrophosphatase MutT (NUDIX family)